MKRAIVTVLSLALAHEALGETDWSSSLSVSTNVDGVVLKLEFADVSVIAGEWLDGRMVVSNASQSPRFLNWGGGVPAGDTSIGQFVVHDDEGNLLPRTIWRTRTENPLGGNEMAGLDVGSWLTFPGDLVKRFSLTNPGIYFVKAVAMVGRPGVKVMHPPIPHPIINPIDGAEEMIIETPFVAVTVLSRPAGMPPPIRLYTDQELAMTPKYRDPPQLQVTHPKPDVMPRVPRAVPRDGNSHVGIVPPKS